MALVQFINDSEPYLNAENLNNNFNELNSITSQFSNVRNWTPVLDNATVTFTKQEGKYIKIGKLVIFWFSLRGTISNTSGDAYAFISGLPHSNNYADTSGSLFEHFNCTSDNSMNLLLRITGNKLCLQKDNNSAGSAAAQWSSGGGTFYLGGSGFYLTNE